ncbi:S-layer homology domain-containing protein [Candidatus Peregrinibacteria bacterium]|nr:S-layer homology domain-containing protein [Candidatus Peregrinibacteria bacterium]
MKNNFQIFFKIFLISLFFVTPVLSEASFPDIESHPYSEAIQFLQTRGIVTGYGDGTFRPNALVNRAEFTKMLVEAKLGKNPLEDAENCFSDVSKSAWFASYICFAKNQKILHGYSDGTFRPEQNISVFEAAKIVVNTFALPLTSEESENWHEPYIILLGKEKYLLTSFSGGEDFVTRAEMAEVIERVLEERHDKESFTGEEFLKKHCLPFLEDPIFHVDMEKVRKVWLEWINAERATQNLSPYTYNNQLNRTAFLWSKFSADRGFIDHKRPGQTAYYDYAIILEWFRNLGLDFENVHRATYSENIGWGIPFSCDATDCTQDMIDLTRYTFDFYKNEKGKEYKPHYDSIMNPYFTEIGMGIAVNSDQKVFITTHYATKIISGPLPICSEEPVS